MDSVVNLTDVDFIGGYQVNPVEPDSFSVLCEVIYNSGIVLHLLLLVT